MEQRINDNGLHQFAIWPKDVVLMLSLDSTDYRTESRVLTISNAFFKEVTIYVMKNTGERCYDLTHS